MLPAANLRQANIVVEHRLFVEDGLQVVGSDDIPLWVEDFPLLLDCGDGLPVVR